jgi:hypothetical protein
VRTPESRETTMYAYIRTSCMNSRKRRPGASSHASKTKLKTKDARAELQRAVDEYLLALESYDDTVTSVSNVKEYIGIMKEIADISAVTQGLKVKEQPEGGVKRTALSMAQNCSPNLMKEITAMIEISRNITGDPRLGRPTLDVYIDGKNETLVFDTRDDAYREYIRLCRDGAELLPLALDRSL